RPGECRLRRALGLAGWQWLFIIKAVPAIILSGVVFFISPTDRRTSAQPSQAGIAIDRQSRRFRRAVCDGLDQGPQRQLRRWRRLASSPWESC
ncbi:MAG TPA: hypothetical protein VKB08_04975, partial [Bradyrhizobium sp.]|nr:hypothetical protein [Bradyrhizobium sp.]